MLSFSESSVLRWVRLLTFFVAAVALLNICPALAQERPNQNQLTIELLVLARKSFGLHRLFIFLVSIYFVTVVIQNLLVLRAYSGRCPA